MHSMDAEPTQMDTLAQYCVDFTDKSVVAKTSLPAQALIYELCHVLLPSLPGIPVYACTRG